MGIQEQNNRKNFEHNVRVPIVLHGYAIAMNIGVVKRVCEQLDATSAEIELRQFRVLALLYTLAISTWFKRK